MKSVRSSCNLNTASGKAAFDLLMVDRRIPAGTQAVLTVVAGGAGVGSAFVDIAWDP
jgi:hypothetical protein